MNDRSKLKGSFTMHWSCRFLLVALMGIAVTCCFPGPLFAQDEVRLTKYEPVKLTADLSHLSDKQREMVVLMIEAAQTMNDCFWYQAYGDRQALLDGISDPKLKRFAEINYGPWNRLDGNSPFIKGFTSKPLGANLYPADMTVEEFSQHLKQHPEDEEAFKSLYTVIRRDDENRLVAIPYSRIFKTEFSLAAEKLRQAAKLAQEPGLKAYLNARADALLSNEYRESDMLWMDMKNNAIDIVIGPIENYEDQLNGYKTACESYVLIKDMSWSERLRKYAAMLPDLQKGLPVPDQYKQETPGTNSDLNAYDVIYYSGDCNAGSKTIAINLPNDEEVQLKKGSRRLQLKNTMRAKFDLILVPIANLLIVPEQRKHITFNAFFSNTMFHEVAHGLGIKNTINGKGRVRENLREAAGALEEGKADILGLYMVTELFNSGQLTEGELEDYYVTFMASVFRSVRFGASSAHGKANMLRFNFFKERNAFTRLENGQYRINIPELKVAATELTNKILKLQGDGDYQGARKFMDEMSFVGPVLQADLQRVERAGIPTDIVFEQGVQTLGLEKDSSSGNADYDLAAVQRRLDIAVGRDEITPAEADRMVKALKAFQSKKKGKSRK